MRRFTIMLMLVLLMSLSDICILSSCGELKAEEDVEVVIEEPTISEPVTNPVVYVSQGITEETPLEPERIYYIVVDDGYTAHLEQGLQDWVYEMCEEYNITGYEDLVIAKLYCESSFRTSLEHHNNNGSVDVGIAQINSCNWEWLEEELGVTDFHDPYQSIRCGVYMLSRHLHNNGYNVHKALVAYNMGQSRVNSGITESNYSRRVVNIMDTLEVN